MASKSNEVSPSRSDLVAKTRRQSILDSPCRVTRSQVKRISSAHVNPPSPIPAPSRRRSVKVQESERYPNNHGEIHPTEEKGTKATKSARNPQRMSRRFSNLESESGEDAISSQSQLESIDEWSKPITRRTRASMKLVADTDSELSLPPTRRTRQSSVSSVASTSTVASSVASPVRRTRGRRNLSPVPSVSASEVSILSEIQEASPHSRKKSSSSQDSQDDCMSSSSLRRSSNSSPAISSAKKLRSDSLFKSSPCTDVSPTSVKGETSFTTPRQLLLSEQDPASSASPRSKRLSTGSLKSVENNSVESHDLLNQSVSSQRSRRRSSGRLSLSSTSKFVESPLDGSPSPQSKESANVIVNPGAETSYSRKSLRTSAGRLSLSKRSSPAKFPHFNETPMNDSPKKINLLETKTESFEKDESDSCSPLTTEVKSQTSRRSSSGTLSPLSHKPSPLQFCKFKEYPMDDSPKKIQFRTEQSSDLEDEESDSSKNIQLEIEQSSIIENEKSNFVSPRGSVKAGKTPQSSHRSSSEKLSMSSSILSPENISNKEKSSDSLENEISDSIAPQVHEQSSQKLQKNSIGRLSSSFNKSSPSKSSYPDDSLLNESSVKIQLDHKSVDNVEESASESGSPKSKQTGESPIPPKSPESASKSGVLNTSSSRQQESAFEPDSPKSERKDESPIPAKTPESSGKSLVLNTSSTRQQSTDRHSFNSSLSSKLGMTPINDSLKSEEHESNVSLIDDEKSFENCSKGSTEKSPGKSLYTTKGNRASTGRLSLGKSKKIDGTVKSRASFGCATDSDVSHLHTAEFKSSSKTLLQSDNCDLSDKSIEVKDLEHFFSDGKRSPDSKLESSLDSHFELKVNSSTCSHKSQKDDQKCVIDYGLLDNPVLLKRKSTEATFTELSEEENDSEKYSDQPDSRSKISRKDVAGKILKDAAYLLSGGDIYDSDGSGSDDNQWELVFSPSTKSKKEIRLEKKAKKRAEKDAHKKSKMEKMKSKHHVNEISESLNMSQSEAKVKETSLYQDEVSEDSSFKAQVLNKKLNSVVGSPRSSKEGDGTAAITDDCAPALDFDCSKGSPVNESGNYLESKNVIDESNRNKKKKKNKKRKHIEGDGPISEIFEEEVSEQVEIDLEMEAKKQSKSTHSDGSPLHKKGRFSDIMQPEENNEILSSEHDGELKRKKKKGKKGNLKDHADFTSVADVEVIDLGGSLLKKRKKTKALASNGETNYTVSDPSVSDSVNSGLKKKKKKKSALEVVCDENLKHTTELGEDVKKKKKKEKATLMTEEAMLESKLNEKKIKGEHKKIVKAPAIDEAIINDGSDSDDAPASVSFAAGKQAALAELQAAAESIRKQKEKKREKLRLKQEKMKEEKLAKIQKLKKKRKPVDPNSISSHKGSKAATSQIFIEKHKDLQSANPSVKPPKRLPADILESLSEQPPSKLIRRPDGSKKRVAETVLSKEEQERLEKKRAKKLALKLEKKKLRESEYIPLEGVLGSTRFGVVPLRNIMLAKKLAKNKLAEEASNFRKENLFGNRIRRTPISKILSHQEKLKASGKDHLVGHRSN